MIHNSFEEQYVEALDRVLHMGIDTGDRTKTGRRRVPNVQFQIKCNKTNLNEIELPVLNGKRVFPLMGCKEMMWMLSGDTNIKRLEENHVTYWREWADENGDLGPVYGHQFRNMNGADQLAYIAEKLVREPMSTQMLINLWNATDLPAMALPPCHFSYYFQVLPDEDTGKNVLNLHLVQRSADAFLGVPYNAIMACYFMQLMAIAYGFEPGTVFWTCHDFHIYHNHFDAVNRYMFNIKEDAYNTCGVSSRLYLNAESMEMLITQYPYEPPVARLDRFITHSFDVHFKNMKVETPAGYGVIAADIAV